MVVAFSPDELSVNNFVTLVSHKAVYGLDDVCQVYTLRKWVGSVLTLGTTIVVVGALEDEAHALGHETDIATLSPAHQVEGQLTETVIVAHVVHGIPPAVQGAIQRLTACGLDRAALDASQSCETRVLRLPNSVVKIELGGKVPFTIVCVLTTNVISVEGEEGLIGRHAGGAGVQLVHQKVKLEEEHEGGRGEGCKGVTDHVAHGIFLESKLVAEVKEDIFYFLRGNGYLAF